MPLSNTDTTIYPNLSDALSVNPEKPKSYPKRVKRIIPQKSDLNLTKSERKIHALKLLKSGKYTKSDIARLTGVSRDTLYQWIEETTKEIKGLDTQSKISLWQSESIKDAYVAGLARDSLRDGLVNTPNAISTAEKRSIMYAASMASGLKWDKSRLEAGQTTDIVGIHAVIADLQAIKRAKAGIPQDVVCDVSVCKDTTTIDI